MELRATLDPEVVAEWERRCAKSRRRSRVLWYLLAVLFLVALLPPLFGSTGYFPYVGWVVGLTVFAVVMLHGVALASISCPNCGETPTTAGQIPLNRIDFCPHCRFWLVNPYGRAGT